MRPALVLLAAVAAALRPLPATPLRRALCTRSVRAPRPEGRPAVRPGPARLHRRARHRGRRRTVAIFVQTSCSAADPTTPQRFCRPARVAAPRFRALTADAETWRRSTASTRSAAPPRSAATARGAMSIVALGQDLRIDHGAVDRHARVRASPRQQPVERPLPAVDWGTKRWGVLREHLQALEDGRALPRRRGRELRAQSREDFAENYRVLNERRPRSRGAALAGGRRKPLPDQTALDLLAQDSPPRGRARLARRCADVRRARPAAASASRRRSTSFSATLHGPANARSRSGSSTSRPEPARLLGRYDPDADPSRSSFAVSARSASGQAGEGLRPLRGWPSRSRSVHAAADTILDAGRLAEWLGRGLQSLVRRFESARPITRKSSNWVPQERSRTRSIAFSALNRRR